MGQVRDSKGAMHAPHAMHAIQATEGEGGKGHDIVLQNF